MAIIGSRVNAFFLKWTSVVGITALGALVFFGLRVPQGFSALREKHQQILELQRQNAELAAENQRRRERIRKLRENPAQLDYEIRRRLKLVRPGETTFIVHDQDKHTAEPKEPEKKESGKK